MKHQRDEASHLAQFYSVATHSKAYAHNKIRPFTEPQCRVRKCTLTMQGTSRFLAGLECSNRQHPRKDLFMEIITMLVIGLLVGIIAKFLMPGRDPGGIIITILLGIAGSFLAYYIGSLIGWYSEGEPVGYIASVIGAIILLLIYRLLFRPSKA